MNQALLPREEYYRPRRAAELRQEAERLEALHRRFSRAWRSLVFIAALLCLAAFLQAPSAPLGWVILTFFAIRGVSEAAGARIRAHLGKRADRLHAEAAALEAEHQGRYREPLPLR